MILINGDTGDCTYELDHGSLEVVSVLFSCDGTRVVSQTYDSTVRMWNAETGLPITIGTGLGIDSPHVSSFSPDGTRLLGLVNDIDILTGDVGPRCISDDGSIGFSLAMDGGWLKRRMDDKIICWVPEERRGNWESRQGKVIMKSLWPLAGIETVIDAEAFLNP